MIVHLVLFIFLKKQNDAIYGCELMSNVFFDKSGYGAIGIKKYFPLFSKNVLLNNNWIFMIMLENFKCFHILLSINRLNFLCNIENHTNFNLSCI